MGPQVVNGLRRLSNNPGKLVDSDGTVGWRRGLLVVGLLLPAHVGLDVHCDARDSCARYTPQHLLDLDRDRALNLVSPTYGPADADKSSKWQEDGAK